MQSDSEQSSKPMVRTVVAISAGFMIKAISLVAAWLMLSTVFPFHTFSYAYFVLTIVLGAFLAGLTVGFLIKTPRKSTLTALFSAVLATLIVSIPLSLYVSFPPGIFLFYGLLPFDLMALVGAAIGATVKMMVSKLIVVLVLTITILIPVHGFIFSPIIQRGELIISGSQTLTIENCIYYQGGNIIVRDNATLTLRNVELFIDQREREHCINITDNACMIAENVNFSVITKNRIHRARSSSNIYITNFATLLLNDTLAPAISLTARQSANATIIGTSCDHPINAYNNSNILVIDSSLKRVRSNDFSNVKCLNTSVIWHICRDNSQWLIENSNRKTLYGFRTYGFIHCYNDSNVEIQDSTIDGILTHSFQGTIRFLNATVNVKINVYSSSSFYVCGNVTLHGSIDEYEGQLTRNYPILTAPNTPMNVTTKEMGSPVWEGRSDNYGHTDFNITFTPQNFTNSLLLNNALEFNITSSTPLTINSPYG